MWVDDICQLYSELLNSVLMRVTCNKKISDTYQAVVPLRYVSVS